MLEFRIIQKQFIINFCFILVVNSFVFSQLNAEKIERLNIGDKVPNYELSDIVNYHSKNAKISDFKGKLLILDYWFTGCRPCIASWPKLNELQQKYKDEIQIMLVNHMESYPEVKSFIEKRNARTNVEFSLPSVTNDSILHKALPPTGYPSIIWINQDGVFMAATVGEELNESNVDALISGDVTKLNTLNWLNKQIPYDFSLPIFSDNNEGLDKNMLWYSRITKYAEGAHNGAQGVNSDSKGYFIIAGNKSILDLIRMAYGKGRDEWGSINDLPYSRLKLNSNKPNRFIRSIDGKIQYQNLFTYQLISKEPKTEERLKKIMKTDLISLFDLNLEWKKEMKKCLVLQSKDSTLISKFRETEDFAFINSENQGIVLDNVPVEIFLNSLRTATDLFHSPYPIIDETGFYGGLDIALGKEFQSLYEMGNYKLLDKNLRKYGMSFTVEDRKVDILYIGDSDGF